MRVLIVDDNIDKISDLSSEIYKIIPEALIETAENITNAISLLEEYEYTLAVIDLLLPLRKDGELRRDGGKFLLNEIYRKNNMNCPKYILGFTQHDDNSLEFSNIWKTLKYNRHSVKWITELNQLLNHLKKLSLHKPTDRAVKPTVFTEGMTDKYYLDQAIAHYYFEFSEKINIKSQTNAGANWVANQVPIWALKHQKDNNQKYIKALGILDSDEAGDLARNKINQRNLTETEQKCCDVYQLKPKYNCDLLLFYKAGCKIEIEIESLFPIEILEYAEKNNWLENRNNPFIENPKDWKKFEESLGQFIERKGISSRYFLLLKKVKSKNKYDFLDYVKSIEDKDFVYQNFQCLIKDILGEIF